MPTYAYYCPTCGARFERAVAAAQADAVQPCPRCQARQPRRVTPERAGPMRQVTAGR